MSELTKQEMFNLAYIGLASQNWERSVDPMTGSCRYECHDGKRCAWGWVDMTLNDKIDPKIGGASVLSLRSDGIGIAAELSYEMASFANSLQEAHDFPVEHLQASMDRFANNCGLTIPAGYHNA